MFIENNENKKFVKKINVSDKISGLLFVQEVRLR